MQWWRGGRERKREKETSKMYVHHQTGPTDDRTRTDTGPVISSMGSCCCSSSDNAEQPSKKNNKSSGVISGLIFLCLTGHLFLSL